MDTTKTPNCKVTVTAIVEDIDREESYFETHYHDVRGHKRTCLIRREEFLTPAKVVRTLVSKNANLPLQIEAACAVIKAAVASAGKRNYKITAQTGWHRTSFVYPTETFGRRAKKLKFNSNRQINPALAVSRGRLNRWRRELKRPCLESDYLVAAIAAAGAGPLLPFVGHEGAIFHLHGSGKAMGQSERRTRSSSGKTLAARTAASFVGRCATSDLFTFAVSPKAVEDFCFSHNHLLAVIDEEGRSFDQANSIGVKSTHLAYVLPSGRGAVRSNKATQDADLKNRCWAVVGFSTGENPLDLPGKTRPEGAQVRMISIPVPAGDEGGIFNRLHGKPGEILKTARSLARSVELTLRKNYGVAAPAYLSHVVAQRREIAKAAQSIADDFVSSVAASDPWEARFAMKFGLLLTAALIMARAKVAPFSEDRAKEAIRDLYRRARAVVTSPTTTTEDLIRRLGKLQATEAFSSISAAAKLTPAERENEIGLIRSRKNGGAVIYVAHSVLAEMASQVSLTPDILQMLADKKIVTKGKDGGFTRQVMLKRLFGKQRKRFVCISPTRLSRAYKALCAKHSLASDQKLDPT
jgi:putative DNA primase/helicase